MTSTNHSWFQFCCFWAKVRKTMSIPKLREQLNANGFWYLKNIIRKMIYYWGKHFLFSRWRSRWASFWPFLWCQRLPMPNSIMKCRSAKVARTDRWNYAASNWAKYWVWFAVLGARGMRWPNPPTECPPSWCPSTDPVLMMRTNGLRIGQTWNWSLHRAWIFITESILLGCVF